MVSVWFQWFEFFFKRPRKVEEWVIVGFRAGLSDAASGFSGLLVGDWWVQEAKPNHQVPVSLVLPRLRGAFAWVLGFQETQICFAGEVVPRVQKGAAHFLAHCEGNRSLAAGYSTLHCGNS